MRQLKLGKKFPDLCNTLKLSNYTTSSLPAPPASVNWAGNIANWGMMLNDKYGNCTCACGGHLVMVWTDAETGTPVVVPDEAVLAMYEAVSGFNPATGANDNGAVISQVLRHWHKHGLNGHRIAGYAYVDPTNETLLKQAVNLFGGLDIGLALPVSAQAQVGQIWDVPVGGAQGAGQPGSWGGHCVPIVGYSDAGLTCVTWGQLQSMTWNFFNTYADEAWAVLSPDWTVKNGVSPEGFNAGQLVDDLRQL